MIILPAIDIKDGRCVRLFQGDYKTAETVADSYLETAQRFADCGAQWIHMVDLDGAKSGQAVHRSVFLEVAKRTKLKVELGGGIRDMNTVEYYLQNGITQIILGSAALQDPGFVKEALSLYGRQIVVGIDAKNEMAAAEGWTATSTMHYIDLAKRMEQMGVSKIIYTDIARDGALTGPNLEQLSRLRRAVGCQIVASGGICCIEDIKALRDLKMDAAICGKSIYSGTLDLKEAIVLAAKKEVRE